MVVVLKKAVLPSVLESPEIRSFGDSIYSSNDQIEDENDDEDENYLMALEHYNRTIQLKPDLTEAYEYRGMLLLKMERKSALPNYQPAT